MGYTEILPARYADGRFGPGNPGRPVGSYNRASRRAALTILDHFESIQEELLNRVASNSERYIKLLSLVLPRQLDIGVAPVEAVTDVDAAQVLAAVRALVAREDDPRATLVELAAVVVGEPGHR